jgi:hypothetical protein
VTRHRTRLIALTVAAALLAAACGSDGDDGTDAETEAAVETETTAADTTTTTDPATAPDTLAAPTVIPTAAIDVDSIGFIVDGEAADVFDRCSLYSAEEITGLLGELWAFDPGEPSQSTGCSWSSGSGTNLGYVLVVMGRVGPEFDARMGDSAATAILGEEEIGDEFYEITGSTYGPGVAFRQGDIGVQIHVIWGTQNLESRLAVERESELRVAENLSRRLP